MDNFSIGEELRKIALAGIGAVAMTVDKTKEIIDELVKKGEITLDEGKVLNEELKHNIKEKLKETVTVVDNDSIMDNLDKLSDEDIAKLKAKLAEIDKAKQAKKVDIDCGDDKTEQPKSASQPCDAKKD